MLRACQGYGAFPITYTSLMIGVPIPSIQVFKPMELRRNKGHSTTLHRVCHGHGTLPRTCTSLDSVTNIKVLILTADLIHELVFFIRHIA